MLSSAFLVKVRDLAGLCRADFASVRDADASEKNPSSSRSVFSDGVRGLLRGHFTLRIFVCGPGVALPQYSEGLAWLVVSFVSSEVFLSALSPFSESIITSDSDLCFDSLQRRKATLTVCRCQRSHNVHLAQRYPGLIGFCFAELVLLDKELQRFQYRPGTLLHLRG
jgi:hypothetical protein